MSYFRNSGQKPNHAFGCVHLISLIITIVVTPIVSGCTGAAVSAGAAVGVAALEERTIGTVADDTKTAAQIRLATLDKGTDYALKIGIDVFEGRVLLTGAVPTEKMRANAVNLAWKVSGVKDVINEIQVSSNGFINSARDIWISAQLTSIIAFDEKIHGINYSLETVGGVIYLIGIAQNQIELNRVINHARNLKYVRNVISHVRIKGPS